jgi:hypothetical protein
MDGLGHKPGPSTPLRLSLARALQALQFSAAWRFATERRTSVPDLSQDRILVTPVEVDLTFSGADTLEEGAGES